MSQYPTDEELMRFITELEKEPLYAPEHLKEEILKSFAGQNITQINKRRQNKIQMFTYSMKIVAGMAAALLLIFTLPQEPMNYQWQGVYEKSEVDLEPVKNGFEETLKKGTDVINDTSSKIINRIMHINQLFDKEDFHYENEEKK